MLSSVSLLTTTTTTTTTTDLALKSRTTWFIDGNNLMGHRGTPRDRQTIADKLQPVENAASDLLVMLVWDGHPGQETTSILPHVKKNMSNNNDNADDKNMDESDRIISTTTTPSSLFQVVSLANGISTDDWIMQQLNELKQLSSSQSSLFSKVQVVTADRALRKKVLEIKPVVKGVVNPVVFWRRYRPRLTGLKSDYTNGPKCSVEEDDLLLS
ncbi:hypothetical protein ACA910_002631 [Epithemia clementina (nom. ined.)]